jgi:hypothetical protein
MVSWFRGFWFQGFWFQGFIQIGIGIGIAIGIDHLTTEYHHLTASQPLRLRAPPTSQYGAAGTATKPNVYGALLEFYPFNCSFWV